VFRVLISTKKDTINGTESWDFDASGSFTSATNTATTGGLSPTTVSYQGAGYVPANATATGDTGIDQGADFFGANFGFLAPTAGSAAGTFYGAGQYTETGANSFEVFFPVLEAQWAGTFFPLGQASGGITFTGTTDGTNFSMYAEETIDAAEDPTAAGFSGWTAEWYYVGTLDGFGASAVPVPAAVWLFGSGLVGLAGVARRRKSA